MKHMSYSVALLIIALVLTGCSSATPQTIPTMVLAPSGSTTSPDTSGEMSVSASGEIVPVQKVNMSFPLTGIVKTVDVKPGDRISAGDTLLTLDTIILEARVAEAEANAASAATQVRYLRRVGPGDEQLNAAIAEVDRANAIVEQMKAMLAQATLVAPIGGTIAWVDISTGETVTPGKVVVIIGDLSRMQVETTDLSEKDVAWVENGQAATVYIEALASELEGSVVDIARISQMVGGDVVYKVTIALNQQPEGLRWGMSADVTIQTER